MSKFAHKFSLKDSPRRVPALAIVACIVWSTAFVGIKIGLRHASPLHLAGLRFMLSGLLIIPFCSNYKKNFRAVLENRRSIFRVSFFSTFVLYSLFHIGISMVPASITALIIGASPLFIAILARFMNNEPLTKRKGLAILNGFSGIALIALGRFGGLMSTEVSILGLGILLLANISGGIGNILVSKNKVDINPVFLNAVQLFFGGVGIFILSLIFEENQFTPKPFEFYMALLWLSSISAIGFSMWFVILKTPGVKVSEINVWKFIIPVLGAILSWIVLPDEHPEWIVVAGMALVAFSLVIMNANFKSKPRL